MNPSAQGLLGLVVGLVFAAYVAYKHYVGYRNKVRRIMAALFVNGWVPEILRQLREHESEDVTAEYRGQINDLVDTVRKSGSQSRFDNKKFGHNVIIVVLGYFAWLELIGKKSGISDSDLTELLQDGYGGMSRISPVLRAYGPNDVWSNFVGRSR